MLFLNSVENSSEYKCDELLNRKYKSANIISIFAGILTIHQNYSILFTI